MEVINVGLYGGKGIFGGRETPLEASVISCDKHHSCSFYKEGKCLNVRGFGSSCKFGSVQNVKGYTSRAKKYHEFKSKWQNHESYGKLSRPSDKLGIIGDYVVFNYPFVRVTETDSGNYKVTEAGMEFGNRVTFIDLEKFNSDLIYRICTYKPQALMGGTITKYAQEVVPKFLAHLHEAMPEKYERFIAAYKQFAKPIDYVGRKALLKTIVPSIVEYRSNGYPKFNEKWFWDGEYLTYKDGYVDRFNIAKNAEIEEIKIKPSEDTEIVVTSNDQVDDKTVFAD